MKAFVLAAGFGSRMVPLTETVPKPLLPVGQIPLIGYSLKLLAANEITEVVVNTHHLGKTLKDRLGDGSDYGVSITYSEEEEILGTGGGLKRMQSVLDETFVVLNSDSVIDLDLPAALAAHRAAGAIATMVLREDSNVEGFGAIDVDQENRVQRILGEGSDADDLRALMFTGAHVIEPRFLEYLPPEVESCVIRYGYRKALANDETVVGYQHHGFWADAGTPTRYLDVNRAALDGTMKMSFANPREGLSGPGEERAEGVTVGAGATIAEDAILHAPVSIGDGAKIASGAVVGPNTVVGDKATIAKGAQVRDSVVLRQAKVDGVFESAIVGRKATLTEAVGPAASAVV
ncbi:MAG: NDP-sugar synthase [Myxococcota bacterium]